VKPLSLLLMYACSVVSYLSLSSFMLRYSLYFVSFDRILIISSLDSYVFRLGTSIYISLSSFTLRLIRVSSRTSTGYGPRLLNHYPYYPSRVLTWST
jgi:hypothetical protein